MLETGLPIVAIPYNNLKTAPVQSGVDPTNNRAERALRFGVTWRKRSLGTASDKGNRWVERILSLKETCRLQTRPTYTADIPHHSHVIE